jgi:hypothetical protein
MKRNLTAGSMLLKHFDRLEVSKWFLRFSFLILWVSGIATNDDANYSFIIPTIETE